MNENKVKTIIKDVAFWGMFVILGILILFILMEAIIPKQTINVFQVKNILQNMTLWNPQ
jgi:signal peptidase I